MSTMAQHRDGRWPVWAVSLVMYPFAAGAAYVNLFFLFLMLQALGIEAISTKQAIYGGVVLGIPFAWISGRWIRGLIDEAEDTADKDADTRP